MSLSLHHRVRIAEERLVTLDVKHGQMLKNSFENVISKYVCHGSYYITKNPFNLTFRYIV